MSLNETISNLGDSIINLVDSKSKATLGRNNGEVCYDKEVLADIIKAKHSTFDINKFIKVGNPTIVNGVASGFSSANYLAIKYLNLKNNFEINFEFTTQSITTQQCIMSCFYVNHPTYSIQIPLLLRIETNGTIVLAVNFLQETSSVVGKWGAVGTSTLVVLPDTKYYGRVTYNGINYQLHISTDGYNFTKYIDIEYSTPFDDYNTFTLGRYVGQNLYPFTGSIDLKQFSITVDGVEVFSGNKTGIDVWKKDNLTKVGSPVISDEGNLLVDQWYRNTVAVPNSIFKQLEDNSWKICFGGHFIKKGYTHQILMYEKNTDGQYEPNGHIKVNYNLAVWVNGAGSAALGIRELVGTEQKIADVGLSSTGTLAEFDYIGYVEYDGVSQYTLAFSRDNGVTWHKKTITSDIKIKTFQDNLCLGGTSATEAAIRKVGTINLNELKVYVNGKLIYQPMLKVPYIETDTGTKIVEYKYRNIVQDIKEQYKSSPYFTVKELGNKNFNVVGSPTIVDDVVSNFDVNNYITSSCYVTPSTEWSVSFSTKFPSSAPTDYKMVCTLARNTSDKAYFRFSGYNIGVEVYAGSDRPTSNNVAVWDYTNINIEWGNWYDVEFGQKSINGVISTYFKLRKTGTSLWEGRTTTGGTMLLSDEKAIYLGRWHTTSYPYTGGSINLKNFVIKVDGKTVYTPYTKPNFTLPQGDIYSNILTQNNMPSEVYKNLTLGASGSTYTAPANGWFYLKKTAGASGKWLRISSNCGASAFAVNDTDNLEVCSPVKKGDVVGVYYSATGDTQAFKFIYAEGSKREYLGE